MQVYAVYFSPTGTTKKIVTGIAREIAGNIQERPQVNEIDFTLGDARNKDISLGRQDVAVIGVPVYAGRVPNVLLSYLSTWNGVGAKAVCVVLYGNRNYDDALIELRDMVQACGFEVIAAGAFVGEHSFSKVLAAGRPDEEDMAVARSFAGDVAIKLKGDENGGDEKLAVKGETPYRKYYMPKDKNGNPVDIRKVTPKTSQDCVDCKLCVEVCPMGSIDGQDTSLLNGICIKCGACIKKCPTGAKYYDDPGYLRHQYELEDQFRERKAPELFL